MSIIIVAFCPREGRGPVELNSFSAKRDFTRFKNDPKNHVAERRSQRSADTSCHARIRLHQSGNNHAASHASHSSTDGYAVRNNEMLKVDKRADDQEGNENPVRNRHLPRKPLPDCEEKKCGNEFYCEIAKRNFCAAMCASATKREPTNQRQIVMPWNRLFALRTKRATRPIYREIDRPTVDTDIQKRADGRAQHERKHAEEEMLSRMLHAIFNWQSVSMRGAPSAMRSRCSFRITDTLAAPWRPKSKYQESA